MWLLKCLSTVIFLDISIQIYSVFILYAMPTVNMLLNNKSCKTHFQNTENSTKQQWMAMIWHILVAIRHNEEKLHILSRFPVLTNLLPNLKPKHFLFLPDWGARQYFFQSWGRNFWNWISIWVRKADYIWTYILKSWGPGCQLVYFISSCEG